MGVLWERRTIHHVEELSYIVWAMLTASVSPVPLLLQHLWQVAVPLERQLLMLSMRLQAQISGRNS